MKESAKQSVSRLLETFPVYKLKDDTSAGYVAHASLSDHGVQVVGDKIVVEYSLWRFSLMVIAGIVIVIVLIIVGIACPEALMAFAWF